MAPLAGQQRILGERGLVAFLKAKCKYALCFL